MGGGDGRVRSAGSDEIREGGVPKVAGSLLKRLVLPRGAGRGVDGADFQRDVEILAELRHELLVAIRRGTANAVVEMNCSEAETQRLPWKIIGGVQGAQQGRGVSPAGDGDGESQAGGELGAIEG